MTLRLSPALLALWLPIETLAAADPPASIETMKSAAGDFIATLDDAGRAKALMKFDDDLREEFRFTPRQRAGLALKEMDEKQRAAAMKLLDAVLSEKGNLKVSRIILLESVLAELEKRPEYRDPGKYHVSIFGDPGGKSPWGWKFEGHHISLNYTVTPDGRFSITPAFLGANPAEVRQGPHTGLRALAEEEDLARALLTVLMENPANGVVFSDKAPAEILTAENRKATALEPVGVAASAMTASQKDALMELIGGFAHRHRKDLADAELEKIRKAGIEQIRFGWAGSTKPGEAWYYRVQGPGFLIEAANTQNNANHIHTTWRSLDGDFGRDILAEHYRLHQKDQGHHH
jgi:hypothetical protein